MSKQLDSKQLLEDPNLLLDALKEREELLEESFNVVSRLRQRVKTLQEGNREPNQTSGQDVQLEEANRKLREEKEIADRKMKTLATENAQLRSEVKARTAEVEQQSSILITLQLNRQDFPAFEAREEYYNFIANIGMFVNDWITPLLRNSELQNEYVLRAKNNKQDTKDFKEYLIKCKDLYDTALNFPYLDLESEILVSFIVRFISDVFDKGFSAIHSECGRMLDIVEHSIRHNVRPKTGEYNIMSWRAQTSFAMLAIPDVQQAQHESRNQLSDTLAHLLGFIIQEKDREAFTNAIATEIIDPAFRLRARFLSSTDTRYSIGIHTGVSPGQNFGGEISQLRNLNCVNVAARLRNFNIDNLNPIPNVEQLRRELYIACSLRPALLMSQAGRGGSLTEPSVVTKEHVLVSWESGKRGKDLMLTPMGGSGFLYRILNAS